MKSSKRSPENKVSFFTSLRRLEREVDQGVKDIQSQLSARSLSSDNNRHLALKGLLDRRKEVESLKSNARTLLSEMRQRGSEFEQSLQLCCQVIESQMQQLCNIQTHLTQYGFVPQPETENISEEDVSQDQGANDAEESSTSSKTSYVKEKIEKRSELSPCLEDFGVSSFTLNMLKQKPQQPFKVPDAAQPASVGRKKTSSRHDSVPTPFQNQGLIVTPSLFPSHSYGTANRSAQEVFSLACSPDMVNSKQVSALDQDCDMQEEEKDVAKTLDFSDSPVPPVLHTPGIKQIPSVKDSVQLHPRERKDVARQLKLGGDDTMDSPVPPVLRTPGIKQISARVTSPERHGSKAGHRAEVRNNDWEIPKTPEMTYSLKDLEDMTVSFRQTDLSSTFSEKSGTAGSDFDTSGSIQAGHLSQQTQQDIKISTLPPQGTGRTQPDDLMEPQLSNWSREKFLTQSSDLPPSPELTMSYSSRSFSKASSQTGFNYYSGAVGSHGSARFSVRQEDGMKNSGLSSGLTGFSSSYSVNKTAKIGDLKSRVLCSTENIDPPHFPELTGKLNHSLGESVLPDQPKLKHDLMDSALDIPPSPKFLGSYHFMGSKH